MPGMKWARIASHFRPVMKTANWSDRKKGMQTMNDLYLVERFNEPRYKPAAHLTFLNNQCHNIVVLALKIGEKYSLENILVNILLVFVRR